jgi:hypothetical protein
MNNQQSSIFPAISYSYIECIHEYLKILNNPTLSTIPYLDEETSHIVNEVKTIFISLPSLLKDESLREHTTSLLLKLRQTLETKFQALHAYKRELQYLSFLASYNHAVTESDYSDYNLTEEDALSLDFEKIAKDSAHFIFSDNNLRQKQEKASAILPFVPMRMTKDSFITYVARSIGSIQIDNTKEAAKELISILSQLLDGKNYRNYGKDFKDFEASISALSSEEDMELFFEDADLLGETLEHTSLLVHSLYRVLCQLSNFMIFDGLTFETITDLHVSFYDLYCSLQNILTDHEDKEILLETLPDRVNEFKSLLEKAYNKACLTEKVDPLFALIRTHIQLDVSNVFGFDAGKHDPYNEEVETVFKDFLASLKEYLLTKKPAERKLRMQYFISVVPFIMNKDQLFAYLKQGFVGTSNVKGNLFTAMLLENVLTESGFFEA